MRDADDDIRSSLERLTEPPRDTAGTDELWDDLVVRRRRRRNRNRALAALPLLLVAVLAVGVFSAQRSDDARSDVAAGGDQSLSADDIGGRWHVAATVHAGERRPTVLDATVTIGDEQGVPVFRAHDGCGNAMMGPLEGNAEASFDGSTLAGCDSAEATEQSLHLFKVLTDATGREARGGELWMLGNGGDGVVLTRNEPAGDASAGTLRVEGITVFGNGPREGGTERAVIEFNEPLPVGGADYVADITTVEAESGIVWTAQGPDTTHVCDSVHGVPEGAVGSVDLLVPMNWFADGEEAQTGPELETIDDPAKFPICGPHNGFIQYAMWSPLSADPADVTVTVSPDRTTVVIEVASSEQTPLDSAESRGYVWKFLLHLRDGDLELAARMWTGYPELGPDSTPADRLSHVEELLTDPTVTRILESDTTTTFVTPSTDEAGQVVTVLDARDGDDAPAAIAFLTGRSDEEGSPGAMRIHRLPLDPPTTATVDLPAGSYVQPGQDIVVPGVPLEGGARAFLDDREVPVVVDYENLSMTITIPEDVEGDIAVTIVTSSPELPGIRAFAVTARP